jgi:hypothetical protein
MTLFLKLHSSGTGNQDYDYKPKYSRKNGRSSKTNLPLVCSLDAMRLSHVWAKVKE